MQRANTFTTALPDGLPSPMASATTGATDCSAPFTVRTALGPILTITGQRPVQVVCFESRMNPQFLKLGHPSGHTTGFMTVTF